MTERVDGYRLTVVQFLALDTDDVPLSILSRLWTIQEPRLWVLYLSALHQLSTAATSKTETDSNGSPYVSPMRPKAARCDR